MENLGPNSNQFDADLPVGSTIIYGLFGRCRLMAIEPKMVGGVLQKFYKLEIKKQSHLKSKGDSVVWVPLHSAHESGLRIPMNPEQVNDCLKLLSSKEHFFDLNQSWNELQLRFHRTMIEEGGFGLSKILSFLTFYKKKSIVPSSEVNRYYERVQKVLLRECADALGLTLKETEEKVSKALRGSQNL